MKRILLTAGILLLLVFLLLHPQEGLAAARTGMTLWLNSLIPALLPFNYSYRCPDSYRKHRKNPASFQAPV